MIETSSDLLRSSSENVWKMLGNVRLAFGTILENIQKSLESGQKSLENRKKRCHQHVYTIKNNITC